MLFRTSKSSRDQTSRGRVAGMRVSCVLLGAVTAVLVAVDSGSANHSYPATYTGSFDTAGTIEFDVSADGTAVTRVQVTGLDVYPCATTIDSTSMGNIPISGTPHAFSASFVTGTFDATQHATGTYTFKTYFPSCTATRNWTATTTAAPPEPEPEPGPAPGPQPGPQPGPEPEPEPEPQPGDTTPPDVALSGKKTQELGKSVAVGVACQEACLASATGFVDVPRTAVAKRLKLRGAEAAIAAGEKQKLKLRVPRKVRRAIRRALESGETVKAKIRVAAADAAGNDTVEKRAIKLTL